MVYSGAQNTPDAPPCFGGSLPCPNTCSEKKKKRGKKMKEQTDDVAHGLPPTLGLQWGTHFRTILCTVRALRRP